MPTSENLLATAERYRFVFDLSPVGFLVYDKDYRILDCNQGLADILRSSREKVVGLDLRKLPDKRILEAVERSLAGDQGSYQGPYEAVTSGARIVASFHSRPVRDESGAIIGGIAVVEDATERVRVEDDLRRQLEVVHEQEATIEALGTPILKVWDGVLCLPIIGAVDSERASELTETMLEAIIDERAHFAIIDLTGVEVVDTSSAQHLVQLFRSAKLVGAEGVLCGLRPAVAQTIIMLGSDLGVVRTMRTMQQALEYCLSVLAKN